MLELPHTRRNGNMSSPHLKQRKTSQTANDIVKSGHLYIKRPPTNMKIRLKTWQKRLMVLRDDIHTKQALLEIYNTESNHYNNKTECFSVNLEQVPAIEEYKESKSFPYAFVLIRRGQSPLVFGVETETEMREWLVALKLLVGKGNSSEVRHTNSDPTLIGSRPRRHSENAALESKNADYMHAHADIFEMFYSHRDRGCDRGHLVQVHPTKASLENNIMGNYMMRVSQTKISLRRTTSVNDVIAWPIAHILKFKSEELGPDQIGDMITLEAGLECHVAQGIFMFKTQSGKELVTGVRDAVRRIGTHQPGADETLESLRSELRPPKQPLGKCESVPNIPYRMRPSLTPEREVSSDGTEVPGAKERGNSLPEVIYNSYLQVIPDEEAGEIDEYSTSAPAEQLPATPPAATEEPAQSVGPCVLRQNLPVHPRCPTQRKDSGFSETFEDSRPSSENVIRRSSSADNSPTPPTPPPRPRHTLVASASNTISARPLPPLPSSVP